MFHIIKIESTQNITLHTLTPKTQNNFRLSKIESKGDTHTHFDETKKE